MVDIVLIQARSSHPLSEAAYRLVGLVPLGLTYIGSVLLKNEFTVEAIDTNLEIHGVSYLKKTLEQKHPTIVGISTATENYSNLVRIAKICKQADPTITVVAGGPHVTFTAEETLRSEEIDIVVRGEGEYAMLEIAENVCHGRKSLADILGISYRKGQKILHNPPRPPIKNLNELPFPARHLFPRDHYPNVACVSSSRGCPGKCIFCAAGALAGGRYRVRTAKNVIEELILLEKDGYNFVFFVDDTFTVYKARLKKICELIKKYRLDLKWACESRVDSASPALSKKMAKAGCIAIQYGVESGSQKVLSGIRKNISIKQILNALSWATEAGIGVACSMVIGLPMDTEETIHDSVAFAKKLQKKYNARVLFSIVTPYPGTPIYEHCEQFGLTLLSRDYDDYNMLTPICNTQNLTTTQIRNLYFDATVDVTLHMPKHVQEYWLKLFKGSGVSFLNFSQRAQNMRIILSKAKVFKEITLEQAIKKKIK